MDAAQLLSLLRTNQPAPPTVTPVVQGPIGAAPPTDTTRTDDLSRLFSAFKNPLISSSPPVTSPAAPSILSHLVHSAPLSPRRSTAEPAKIHDASREESRNVNGKRTGPTLDQRTPVVQESMGNIPDRSESQPPVAIAIEAGSISYPAPPLDLSPPESAPVTRSIALDAKSLLDSLMRPKPASSPQAVTTPPSMSPLAPRLPATDSNSFTGERVAVELEARVINGNTIDRSIFNVGVGGNDNVETGVTTRQDARESSVPQSAFTFSSPAPMTPLAPIITPAPPVVAVVPVSTLTPVVKSGIVLRKSPSFEDRLVIDITRDHEESKFNGEIETVPITLFKNEIIWEAGNRVAAWDKGLCYATRPGKIRIIDRNSGARLLLKGHAGPLLDLAISPLCPATPGREPTRIVISVGSDGGLLFWRILDEFTDATTSHEEMHALVTAENRISASLVRFSPRFAQDSLIAIARSDGTVEEYPLSELTGPIANWNIKKTTGKAGPSIVDMSYSPDGTALAILYTDGHYVIKSTRAHAGPTVFISFPATLPIGSATQIAFISSGASPTAVVVSSDNGNELRILSLEPGNQTTRNIKFVGPDSLGHLHFDIPTSTLLVSNSVRGSLFALHFDCPNSGDFTSALDDVTFIHQLSKPSTNVSVPRIDHLTELKTTEPIINFYLDDSRRATDRLAALCVHPKGIHMILFELPVVENQRQEDVQEEERERVMREKVGNVRRPSLQDTISVLSEVVVKVEEEEVLSAVSEAVVTKASVTIKEEKEELLKVGPVDSKPEAVPELSRSAATIPSASNQISAAIKSMKAKNNDKAIKIESTPASPRATAVNNAWATGGVNITASANGKKGGAKNESTEAVLKGLQKLEDNLPMQMADLMTRMFSSIETQIAQQNERFEEQRRFDQLAEATRQEAILKLVSTTLTNNTSAMVEKTIKEHIQSQVIPSIASLVTSALNDQIQQGFNDALTDSIPKELESLLRQPSTLVHLSESITSTIVPSLHHDLAHTIADSVIPTLNTSISTAVDSVMLSLGKQVMAVVQQQISALESTAGAVNGMREEMRGMRERIGQLEKSLEKVSIPITATATTDVTTTSVPREQRSQRAVSSPQVNQVVSKSTQVQPQSMTAEALSPVPRSATPFERYEEMFTDALQPTHEDSAFLQLAHLIDSSPPSRLEAVFPASPLRPRVSSAVVLSLAFRLAQMVESGQGVLEQAETAKLAWIRRCLVAMDGKDLDTAAYTPRILENVIGSLAKRAISLGYAGDRRGREEVIIMEQYSRSRLGLFE